MVEDGGGWAGTMGPPARIKGDGDPTGTSTTTDMGLVDIVTIGGILIITTNLTMGELNNRCQQPYPNNHIRKCVHFWVSMLLEKLQVT